MVRGFRFEDLARNGKTKRILKKFKKDRVVYKDKRNKGYNCPAK